MSEARILPVVDPSDEVAELLGKTIILNQEPLRIFSTLAHHPMLLQRVNALGGLFLRHGLVPAREREIIILRVAAACGSAYELTQHRRIGSDCGLSADEIEALELNKRGIWREREEVLLDMVSELIASDVVGERVWRQLETEWSQAQILELLMIVGFYRMVAGFLNSANVQIET